MGICQPSNIGINKTNLVLRESTSQLLVATLDEFRGRLERELVF
jgi:hypothetical protein